MSVSPDNLVWLDLEMTGLSVNDNKIIEIATIITNKELEVIAVGPELAIYQNEITMQQMNTWCVKQHTKTGLFDRVKNSKITEKEAENLTLEFIKKYVKEKASPMCGNSICMDRRFLAKYMPNLEAYFHYRNLDVSTVKILTQLWAKDVYEKLTKKSVHRAKDDIIESIEELKLYRKEFLICK